MLLKTYLSGKLSLEDDKITEIYLSNFSKDYYAFLDDEKEEKRRK